MPAIRSSVASPAGRSGAVLIATLAIIVLITLIVVALSLSMNLERSAAYSYENNASAELFAREGIEDVRAALNSATVPATNYWFSAPGELVYAANGATNAVILSSGTTVSAATSGVYQPYDLNRNAVSVDQLRVISGTTSAADNMNVGWIYVYQSGKRETSQAPTLSAADPVIGRFAYWADDESSRLNLNTSWGLAGNTNSLNHPSRLDLTPIVGSAYSTEIHTNAAVSPFNSPDDARRLDPGLAPIISTNRFSLTHYNPSANLNPFGGTKILLTTQKSVADACGSTNYLNILVTPNTDPGWATNLSAANLGTTLNNLVPLLQTNWPVFNASFAQKYNNPAAPNRAAQLALDIVEYVRAAESTSPVVEFIRGSYTNNAVVFGNTSISSFVGTARHPMITQMVMFVSDTQLGPAASPYWSAQAVATVYNPPGYNIGSVTIKQDVDIVSQSDSSIYQSLTAAASTLVLGNTDTTVLGSDPLTPGSSCVVIENFRLTHNPVGLTSQPLRITLEGRDGQPWESAAKDFAVAGVAVQVPLIHNATALLGQAITLAEINDPRVNKCPSDWTSTTDKLGSLPSTWATPVTALPPQDTLSGGAVDTNDLYMPPPKGQPGNVAGMVMSVADLGHVTTGAESQVAGVPWRTISLQPHGLSSNPVPPDWALLDLFEAPYYGTTNAVYQPLPNTLAGRVNLNSAQWSHGLATNSGTTLTRTAPLDALFATATNLSASARGTAATNVATMTLAAGGTNYGLPLYFSPAEMVEMQGVSDQGEASEANLRGLVDLATTQGLAYRVYSVGQTLKQTPDGELLVESEQYREAILRSYNAATPSGVVLLWKSVPP